MKSFSILDGLTPEGKVVLCMEEPVTGGFKRHVWALKIDEIRSLRKAVSTEATQEVPIVKESQCRHLSPLEQRLAIAEKAIAMLIESHKELVTPTQYNAIDKCISDDRKQVRKLTEIVDGQKEHLNYAITTLSAVRDEVHLINSRQDHDHKHMMGVTEQVSHNTGAIAANAIHMSKIKEALSS